MWPRSKTPSLLSPTLVNQFLVGLHRSTSNQTYGNAYTFSEHRHERPAAG